MRPLQILLAELCYAIPMPSHNGSASEGGSEMCCRPRCTLCSGAAAQIYTFCSASGVCFPTWEGNATGRRAKKVKVGTKSQWTHCFPLPLF